MTRKLEMMQQRRDDFLETKYGHLTLGEMGALFVTVGPTNPCYKDLLEAYTTKVTKITLEAMKY